MSAPVTPDGATASLPIPAVDVRDLVVEFPSRAGVLRVLDDVSLTIPSGQFVSLIGPSGCGKTTLMRSLATLVAPKSGQITVNGKLPDDARRNREVGFVFQSAALLDWRDAERNVMLPLELEGLPKEEARKRAEALLERVGLTKFRHHYPRQMSGGMQQRVSIARALSTDPGILLMDEPFAALDEITRERMNAWLIDLWTARGFTVVFVTHNIREAILLSDRIVVMAPHPGRIIGDFTVNLPRPRGVEVRDSAEFREVRRLGERLLAQAMTGEVGVEDEEVSGGGSDN